LKHEGASHSLWTNPTNGAVEAVSVSDGDLEIRSCMLPSCSSSPASPIQLVEVLRGMYGVKLSEIATEVRRLMKSLPNTRNE
jgi:hypothetical protein